MQPKFYSNGLCPPQCCASSYFINVPCCGCAESTSPIFMNKIFLASRGFKAGVYYLPRRIEATLTQASIEARPILCYYLLSYADQDTDVLVCHAGKLQARSVKVTSDGFFQWFVPAWGYNLPNQWTFRSLELKSPGACLVPSSGRNGENQAIGKIGGVSIIPSTQSVRYKPDLQGIRENRE